MPNTITISTPESRNISKFEYDPSNNVLRISFKRNNRQYDFYAVPIELVDSLRSAMSKTTFFNLNIKNKFKTLRVN